MQRRQHVMRQRYDATAQGYDELYAEEQAEKYAVVLTRIKPKGRVLDAGCGTGLLAEYMEITGLSSRLSLYVCLELSPRMLEQASQRLGRLRGMLYEAVEGDLEHLPFRDNAFDISYSFTVVDLLHNPSRGLRELGRVTRETAVFSLLKKAHLLRRASPAERYLAETDKDWILVLRNAEKEG